MRTTTRKICPTYLSCQVNFTAELWCFARKKKSMTKENQIEVYSPSLLLQWSAVKRQLIHPVLSVWFLGGADDGTGHCQHLASLSLSAHDKASKSGRNAPRRQGCRLLLGCFPLEKLQAGDKIFLLLFHRVTSRVVKFKEKTFLSRGKNKVQSTAMFPKLVALVQGFLLLGCLVLVFNRDRKVLIWKASTNKLSTLWIRMFAALFICSKYVCFFFPIWSMQN